LDFQNYIGHSNWLLECRNFTALFIILEIPIKLNSYKIDAKSIIYYKTIKIKFDIILHRNYESKNVYNLLLLFYSFYMFIVLYFLYLYGSDLAIYLLEKRLFSLKKLNDISHIYLSMM